MDPAAVEPALKAFFTADPRGALSVYLYGSVARGEARADSDLDIVRDVVENHLGDLLELVAAIRVRL